MTKIVPYLAIFAGLILCAIVVPAAIDTLDVASDFDDFVAVSATVTSTRTQKHSRGHDTGVVEYEFATTDGTVVKGDNALTRISDSPELIDELVQQEGGVERITVYYDPNDPHRSVIREVHVWQPLGFIGLSGLLLVAGTSAWVQDRGRRRLQARADAARRR